MRNEDVMEALSVLAAEKGISTDTVLGALADALESPLPGLGIRWL